MAPTAIPVLVVPQSADHIQNFAQADTEPAEQVDTAVVEPVSEQRTSSLYLEQVREEGEESTFAPWAEESSVQVT